MTSPTIPTAAHHATPAGSRRALIVVDVQNDFCEGGSLAVTGGADLAGRISDYLAEHAADYYLIVATRDWHVDPGAHFAAAGAAPDFDISWPVHCVAASDGANFHPQLRLPAGTVIISKGAHDGAFSGFEGATDTGVSLHDVLAGEEVTDIDVVGIATSFCDKATALSGAELGYRTRLLARYCVDVTGVDTESAFAELDGAGVQVVR